MNKNLLIDGIELWGSAIRQKAYSSLKSAHEKLNQQIIHEISQNQSGLIKIRKIANSILKFTFLRKQKNQIKTILKLNIGQEQQVIRNSILNKIQKGLLDQHIQYNNIYPLITRSLQIFLKNYANNYKKEGQFSNYIQNQFMVTQQISEKKYNIAVSNNIYSVKFEIQQNNSDVNQNKIEINISPENKENSNNQKINKKIETIKQRQIIVNLSNKQKLKQMEEKKRKLLQNLKKIELQIKILNDQTHQKQLLQQDPGLKALQLVRKMNQMRKQRQEKSLKQKRKQIEKIITKKITQQQKSKNDKKYNAYFNNMQQTNIKQQSQNTILQMQKRQKIYPNNQTKGINKQSDKMKSPQIILKLDPKKHHYPTNKYMISVIQQQKKNKLNKKPNQYHQKSDQVKNKIYLPPLNSLQNQTNQQIFKNNNNNFLKNQSFKDNTLKEANLQSQIQSKQINQNIDDFLNQFAMPSPNMEQYIIKKLISDHKQHENKQNK